MDSQKHDAAQPAAAAQDKRFYSKVVKNDNFIRVCYLVTSMRMEDYWRSPEAIRAFEKHRQLFREASAKVVRKVFGQYIGDRDRILEIGSGLGELVNLVPEYKSRIQQTEQSEEIARENRKADPDSNIVVANVYNLPFSDHSFDIATGYSVFDTFVDLNGALREVRRILSLGGRFIHFQDIQPSPNTFFHRYASEDVVPFAFFERDNITSKTALTGLQLVRRKDLQKLRKEYASTGLEVYFDSYVNNPELHFSLGLNNPELLSVLYDDFKSVQKSGLAFHVVRFYEDFKSNLESSMAQTGYEIIESRKRNGVVVISRNHRHDPRFNFFHNDLGTDKSEHMGRRTKVKVSSTLYVAVARRN